MTTPGKSGAERMFGNLLSFLRASNWTESKHILERHPELMNDAGSFMIDAMASDPQTATNVFPMFGNAEALRMVDQHRTILARSKEVGIDRAFREMT
jgi:hypothetical protein